MGLKCGDLSCDMVCSLGVRCSLRSWYVVPPPFFGACSSDPYDGSARDCFHAHPPDMDLG